MSSLGEKLSSRGDGVLVTMELSPPNIGDVPDRERFQRHLSQVRDGIHSGLIDGFTTNSLPQFTPKEIKDIQEIAPAFLELIGCDADTIEAILMEVTRRTSSMDLGHLGELEGFHIPTLALQNNFPSDIRKKVKKKAFDSHSIFVVSGGHPLRKLVALLDHKFPLAGRLAKLALLYNYDSSKATKDIRTSRPDVTSIFGAWNPALESINTVARKAQSGMNGLLTQPASFLPQLFIRALQGLRNNEHTKNLRVQIGIPFIGSAKALKKWFFLMGISPEKHLEAGFLLESFERAERDGRLTFFAGTWTRNCLEWALSLAGADGVHYMPHLVNERTMRLLRDARSLEQHSTGMDVHLATKQTLIDWEIRFDNLPKRTPLRYLPGMLETGKDKKEYSAEFLPLLDPTYRTIDELQKQHPDSEIWKGFSVNFVRMPQNNHAHTLPIELITDDVHSFHDLVIDVRYPSYKTQPELFSTRLREALVGFLEKKEHQNHIFLGQRGKSPAFLEQALAQGWNIFSDVQKSSGSIDVGTHIAKNEIVYKHSAQEFFNNLKNADPKEEYAIAEIGVYDANGIPQMLRHLVELINADDDKEKLLQRLKKTVFVCVDIAKRGIETCQEVLSKCPEANLFKEFKYIHGDILREECYSQLEKWKGEFLLFRAINTLCAFDDPVYVMRQGQPYRVDSDTFISTDDLHQLVHDLYPKETPVSKNSKHLKYFIDGVEQPSLPTCTVKAQDIIMALNNAVLSPDKVKAFIDALTLQTHIHRSAAGLIWERVVQILKRKKRYAFLEGKEAEHARAVADHHPYSSAPFTLSESATSYMSHLGPYLDRKVGSAWFASLVSGTPEQHNLSHSSSQGRATKSVTSGYPVQTEYAHMVLGHNGFDFQVLPRREYPKSETVFPHTVSVMILSHKKDI